MDRLGNSSFLAYLSPALRKDSFFKALAESLDPVLAAYLKKIPVNIIISNLLNQPEEVLDFLAIFHFNVDAYDLDFPYDKKLALTQNAIKNKINKGTPAAIKNVIALAFDYCELIEWWQETPPGIPHTFRLKINDSLVDPVKLDRIVKAILKLKNVRSLYTGASSFLLVPPGTLYLLGNVNLYDYEVLPYLPTLA